MEEEPVSEDAGAGDPSIRRSPSTGPGSPEVWGLHDAATGSVQYVCACPATRACAVIDPVWDLDAASLATSTRQADRLTALVEGEGLRVEWILDTHPHADHLTASALLAGRTGARTAIGERVREIAALWEEFYHLPGAFDPARDFDRLLADGDAVRVGELELRAALAPGHTLGSVSYRCGDAAFVHDTVMHVDAGTARCDFPGGSAAALWDTVRGILALPGQTRLMVGHDYGAPGREAPAWEATVAEHRAGNVHVRDGTRREEWIARREARDATLALPARMLAALQVNLRGGRLPPAEADGRRYLKMPLDRF